MRGRFLFALLVCSGAVTARAQETRATVSRSDTAEFPPSHAGSLSEICAWAARSEWAQSAAAGGELACSIEPGPEPELVLLRIRVPDGEALFLAVVHEGRYALAGELEAASLAILAMAT